MRIGLVENKISMEVVESLKKMIAKLNTNDQLVTELIYLVIPRKPKFNRSTATSDLSSQSSTVLGAMEKICFESVIREPGWKRLPSIVKITNQLPGTSILKKSD